MCVCVLCVCACVYVCVSCARVCKILTLQAPVSMLCMHLYKNSHCGTHLHKLHVSVVAHGFEHQKPPPLDGLVVAVCACVRMCTCVCVFFICLSVSV
jgi:hypothetical protein